MINPPKNTDASIDLILQALRDTEPPTGLEDRIAKRIAEVSEARTITTSHFTVTNSPTSAPFLAAILNAVKYPRILFVDTKLYTFAATALALLLTFSLFALHHHKPRTIAQSKPLPASAKPYTPPQKTALAQARPAAHAIPNERQQPASSLPPSQITLANPATPADPDTIALAETLAPSRPAPPMPLTQQERLILSVVRSGDQEEIAALDPAKRDALFARDQAAFRDFFAPPTPAATTGDKE